MFEYEEMVLITGGAGFIGSHLVESFARSSERRIRVLDDFSRGSRANLAAVAGRVEVIAGDVADRTTVEAAMSNCDVVIHLAAVSRVVRAEEDPDTCIRTNVEGTYEVLRAAERARVRRIVFASSREVYGEPAALPVIETAPLRAKNLYGASKIGGEALCGAFQRRGLPIVILRLANVFGPRDSDRVVPLFLSRAYRSEPMIIFGGDQILDLISVQHVIPAFGEAAFGCDPGEPVNIGSGTPTRLEELAEWIQEYSLSECGVRIEPARPMEVRGFVADITRSRRWLGFRARSPREDVQVLCESSDNGFRRP